LSAEDYLAAEFPANAVPSRGFADLFRADWKHTTLNQLASVEVLPKIRRAHHHFLQALAHHAACP
jgi:hypothetical protein